ncbi:DUF4142 domain-containing protein [Olivibacter sp. SDN3]|uniref:DUF4142 domain-containing protein n=1 Tax=Olivibacter sp. SDN3 TaxID=2764720 RepID=UPI001650F04F|nr:DUF4142 domain-containing protein [Olivibacter sp. SDN3]QNL47835.1 DUF4142 domain-containing protein [Olivibacter sp. SDN3]
MKTAILTLITPAILTLFACNSSTSESGTSNSDTTLTATGQDRGGGVESARGNLNDEEFVKEAVNGGMAEVELGELAVEKAEDAKVKEFANMMITDHTKANEELKILADKKEISLPIEPTAEKKMVKKNLSSLSGEEFDKAYIEQMVKDHTKTISLFEKQMTSVKDPELKTFIENTLPTIKGHLEHCRKLSE